MNRVYGERSFEDGILMLGDNFYIDANEADDFQKVKEKYFEQPYQFLLDQGVPFYAALGNHDYNYGLYQSEINDPVFHFEGRRYYSKVFNQGLVEIFFLDSEGLLRGGDEGQIAWG